MVDMDVFAAIFATASSAGIIAAVTKLFSLGVGQAQMRQALEDHVQDEKGKFEGIARRFDSIDNQLTAGLPNGEIDEILTRLVGIEGHLGMRRKRNSRRLQASLARRGR